MSENRPVDVRRGPLLRGVCAAAGTALALTLAGCTGGNDRGNNDVPTTAAPEVITANQQALLDIGYGVLTAYNNGTMKPGVILSIEKSDLVYGSQQITFSRQVDHIDQGVSLIIRTESDASPTADKIHEYQPSDIRFVGYDGFDCKPQPDTRLSRMCVDTGSQLIGVDTADPYDAEWMDDVVVYMQDTADFVIG